MAKPDTDDGWLKYAHELDAALAAADFTKGARIVLREVFVQIFGKGKHRTAVISPPVISGRTGYDRAHVYRAIRELTESGVIVAGDCGRFRFVKDYQKWTKNGLPRLSPSEVKYAQDAPRLALNPLLIEVAPQPTHKRKACANPGTVVPIPAQEVVPIPAQICADPGTDLCQSRHTPTIGTHAELKTGRLETVVVVGGRPATGPREPVEYTPLGHAILGPGHRDCIDLARSLFGDAFAEVVADRGRAITFTIGEQWDCLAAAIEYAHRLSKTRRLGDVYGYVRKTAEGYAMTGIPPAPVAAGTDAPATAAAGPGRRSNLMTAAEREYFTSLLPEV